MIEIKKHNLIILGSGPAGYTAGIYAARAGLNPCIITGMEQGGQLTTTTDVENWPGDSDNLQGPELMERMLKHVETLDVEVIFDHIEKADLSSENYKLTGSMATYECQTLRTLSRHVKKSGVAKPVTVARMYTCQNVS